MPSTTKSVVCMFCQSFDCFFIPFCIELLRVTFGSLNNLDIFMHMSNHQIWNWNSEVMCCHDSVHYFDEHCFVYYFIASELFSLPQVDISVAWYHNFLILAELHIFLTDLKKRKRKKNVYFHLLVSWMTLNKPRGRYMNITR